MQARLVTILSLAVLALTGLAVVSAQDLDQGLGLDARDAVASSGIEGEGDIPLPATEPG